MYTLHSHAMHEHSFLSIICNVDKISGQPMCLNRKFKGILITQWTLKAIFFYVPCTWTQCMCALCEKVGYMKVTNIYFHPVTLWSFYWQAEKFTFH